LTVGARPEDLIRVAEFRNRLVAFMNYLGENVRRYESTPQHVQSHIGDEQAWLAQEYGRVYKLVEPYGIAQMTQFRRIASTDVVRDAIGSPTHPEYGALAQMAVQHLDMVIGQMRAEVEDRSATRRLPDDLYRLTSPVYWLGRFIIFGRWLLGTTRGRIAGGISLLVVAIVSGIVSGAAQAWFQQLMAGR
jgi:hypothetical protein